jgi:hypothetical protein
LTRDHRARRRTASRAHVAGRFATASNAERGAGRVASSARAHAECACDERGRRAAREESPQGGRQFRFHGRKYLRRRSWRRPMVAGARGSFCEDDEIRRARSPFYGRAVAGGAASSSNASISPRARWRGFRRRYRLEGIGCLDGFPRRHPFGVGGHRTALCCYHGQLSCAPWASHVSILAS